MSGAWMLAIAIIVIYCYWKGLRLPVLQNKHVLWRTGALAKESDTPGFEFQLYHLY